MAREVTFQQYFEDGLGAANFEALELLSSERDVVIRSKLPHIAVATVGSAVVMFVLMCLEDQAGGVL